MLKTIISPVQMWLLRRGQCVGCGMPLRKASKKQHAMGDLHTCKCGRSFFHLKDGNWRRALMSELKK